MNDFFKRIDNEWGFIHNEILDRLNIFISCPECENQDDDQYQCGTCGGAGGGNSINVLSFLQENVN